MLSDAGLPNTYWFDALEYAITLHNVLPTCALTDVTPEEAWSRNKPNISYLRIFGCSTHMHVPKEHWDKLGSKSILCTFLGYAHNNSTYHLVHWHSQWVFKSCNVIFNELRHPHECTIIDPGTTEGQVRLPLEECRPIHTIHTPIKDDDEHYKDVLRTTIDPCQHGKGGQVERPKDLLWSHEEIRCSALGNGLWAGEESL